MRESRYRRKQPDDESILGLREKLVSAAGRIGEPSGNPDFEAVYREAAGRLARKRTAGRRNRKRMLIAAAVFAALLVPFVGIAAASNIGSQRMAESEVRLLLDGVFDRPLFPDVEYARLLRVSLSEP